MRWRVFITVLLLLLVCGVSQARDPYVKSIQEESGSLDGVSVDITRARQADMLADGYDQWGIRGKNIYIEATAVNRTQELLEFRVTFSARNVFGDVVDTCSKPFRLGPEQKQEFKCMLSVGDARKFFDITYRVSPGFGKPSRVP